MVIVNKKPPSKKVPLLLFQFTSPPTWNNWLSPLLNLYYFVINLYSSSSPLLRSNHIFVSSYLFFFFFLTRPHEVEEWWSAAHFSLFRQSYLSDLMVVSVGIEPFRLLFPPESEWIEKKKKRRLNTLDARRCVRRIRCRCSNPRARGVHGSVGSVLFQICYRTNRDRFCNN